MRLLLAAIVFVSVLVPHARADWGYTKWGMTPEQVAGASKGAVKVVPVAGRYRNEEDHWEIAAQGTFRAATLTLDVGFTFDLKTGGLKCVLYNATGQDVEALKDMMIKDHGPPAKESNYGSARSLSWTTPDQIGLVIAQKAGTAVVTHCAP